MPQTIREVQGSLDLPLRPEIRAEEERSARLRAAGIRPSTRSFARPRRRPAARRSGLLGLLRRMFR